jgi:hypothetical protein
VYKSMYQDIFVPSVKGVTSNVSKSKGCSQNSVVQMDSKINELVMSVQLN